MKAVIFDLDDTLYPESQFVLSGFKKVAEEVEKLLGISKIKGFSELKKLYNNGIRGNTFDIWLSNYQANTPEIIIQLLNTYRNHFPAISLFPGINELLKEIKSGKKIGIVSDGYLISQRNKAEALSLFQIFDGIIFTEQWGREYWKPHVRGYEEILRILKVEAENSIYIGDNPTKDFIGARALGMFTIRLRQNTGEYSKIEAPTDAHLPHIEFNSITELSNYLI